MAETDTDAADQFDARVQPQPIDERTPGLWRRYRRLPANVFFVSLVSLLNDASSEIIYPLLPVFLAGTLAASPWVVGLIEGGAESVSSFLKLFAGYWSDRRGRRKGLVVFGYALAGVARPLLGFAASWPQVFAVRFVDRVGKGVRSAPRDAMIADSVRPAERGLAFGLHRAMDHTGAVVGPLLGFALLALVAANADAPTAAEFRTVFLLASVPALAAVLVAIFAIREAHAARPDGATTNAAAATTTAATATTAATNATDATNAGDKTSASVTTNATDAATSATAATTDANGVATNATDAAAGVTGAATSASGASVAAAGGRGGKGGGAVALARLSLRGFDSNFKRFLVILALFTLSNSSDAFLLLRASEAGISTATIPLLWAALHVCKVVSSLIGGDLSDRLGRKRLIVSGWLFYAAVYTGFAFVSGPAGVWALFLVYGVYFGLAEGAEKALVADLVRAEQRGTAYGLYNLAFSVTVWPASLLMGLVWKWRGPAFAFLASAAVGVSAALLLWAVVKTGPSREAASSS
jgi:MFS family permease